MSTFVIKSENRSVAHFGITSPNIGAPSLKISELPRPRSHPSVQRGLGKASWDRTLPDTYPFARRLRISALPVGRCAL